MNIGPSTQQRNVHEALTLLGTDPSNGFNIDGILGIFEKIFAQPGFFHPDPARSYLRNDHVSRYGPPYERHELPQFKKRIEAVKILRMYGRFQGYGMLAGSLF